MNWADGSTALSCFSDRLSGAEMLWYYVTGFADPTDEPRSFIRGYEIPGTARRPHLHAVGNCPVADFPENDTPSFLFCHRMSAWPSPVKSFASSKRHWLEIRVSYGSASASSPPLISQIATRPSLFCHRMSSCPSPVKSAVSLKAHVLDRPAYGSASGELAAADLPNRDPAIGVPPQDVVLTPSPLNSLVSKIFHVLLARPMVPLSVRSPPLIPQNATRPSSCRHRMSTVAVAIELVVVLNVPRGARRS